MTFGEALEALNNGAFVARKGWNDKGIFIYKVEASVARKGWTGKGIFIYKVEASEATYDKLRGRCKDAIDYVYKHVKDDEPQIVQEAVRINAHIDMKAADGSIVVGWLASQTDMLADDWCIVKEAD